MLISLFKTVHLLHAEFSLFVFLSINLSNYSIKWRTDNGHFPVKGGGAKT
jgi:hypothetical protein